MSKFCGARPHKMLTLMNWNSIYFFGLSPEVLWKNERTEKKLNGTMLSPNSVPEGHWQITSKCTKWIKKTQIRKAYEKKLAKKRPFLCRLGKSRFRAILFFHPRSQLFVVFYSTFIGSKKFSTHVHIWKHKKIRSHRSQNFSKSQFFWSFFAPQPPFTAIPLIFDGCWLRWKTSGVKK